MPAYIQTNTARYSEGDFTIRGQNIINGTKENPDFPDLPHNVKETVEPKFLAYKALNKESYQMSGKDYDDRNTLRQELNVMFRENGLYIVARYAQDRNKQISSNYEPVKTPDRSGVATTPYGVKASTGDRSGEVKLYWKKVSNARGYTVKYRLKDNAEDPWKYKSVTKSRGVVIDGLLSGEMYEVWVMALGAKKDSDYGGPSEARAK